MSIAKVAVTSLLVIGVLLYGPMVGIGQAVDPDMQPLVIDNSPNPAPVHIDSVDVTHTNDSVTFTGQFSSLYDPNSLAPVFQGMNGWNIELYTNSDQNAVTGNPSGYDEQFYFLGTDGSARMYSNYGPHNIYVDPDGSPTSVVSYATSTNLDPGSFSISSTPLWEAGLLYQGTFSFLLPIALLTDSNDWLLDYEFRSFWNNNYSNTIQRYGGTSYSDTSYSYTYASVPEPSTLLLLSGGLASLALFRMRRKGTL
jgi:hypothetical protein